MATRKTTMSELERARVYRPGAPTTTAEREAALRLQPPGGRFAGPRTGPKIPRLYDEQIYTPPPSMYSNPAADARTAPPKLVKDANALISGAAPPSLKGSAEFNAAVKQMRESSNFLRLSTLSTKTKDPGYVVGGQRRIAELQSAQAKLRELVASDKSPIKLARKKLDAYAKEEISKTLQQRMSVQSVLAQYRAKQRDAMRVNAEVSTGRRPRRSAGSVIPRMPGLLTQTTRRS